MIHIVGSRLSVAFKAFPPLVSFPFVSKSTIERRISASTASYSPESFLCLIQKTIASTAKRTVKMADVMMSAVSFSLTSSVTVADFGIVPSAG